MGGLKSDLDLELVRGFMNTIELDEDVDELSDPDAFGTWLAGHDLAAEGARIGSDELTAARTLRTALRELAEANHDGSVPPGAFETLTDVGAAAGTAVRFTPGGEVEVTATAPGATGVLGRLVAAVAAAIADGSWQRVKLCSNEGCAWVFYDESRNRSGRWCTMAVCGNRMKARTFRERHS